ncbi:MAG: molybdopterin cofactor-binding domain-containing protein, partial [Pseudomonadota bacterium]
MAFDEYDSEDRIFANVGTRPVRPDGIDKVTGRAMFGADMSAPGMLTGAVLRSPYAHARIVRMDTSKAEALPGVKAVVTRGDFNADAAEQDVLDNCMAGDKVLYDGHALAALAAVNPRVARKALKLIEVEYDVLDHVTDVDEAMKPGAPVVRDAGGDESVPDGLSKNVMSMCEFGHGDVDQGFAEADFILERSFKTAAAHQGYIEPHACLGSLGADGRGELWVCTQGHFYVRNLCADLLGIDSTQLRVIASEIGGGFGGKTTVFIEPLALALSRKSNRPVKMVMSRAEVFRATGPTSSTSMDVKIGMKSDGTMTAGLAVNRFQGGAYPGAPVDMGAMCSFACYALENVKSVGYDVICNRPKQAA